MSVRKEFIITYFGFRLLPFSGLKDYYNELEQIAELDRQLVNEIGDEQVSELVRRIELDVEVVEEYERECDIKDPEERRTAVSRYFDTILKEYEEN